MFKTLNKNQLFLNFQKGVYFREGFREVRNDFQTFSSMCRFLKLETFSIKNHCKSINLKLSLVKRAREEGDISIAFGCLTKINSSTISLKFVCIDLQ